MKIVFFSFFFYSYSASDLISEYLKKYSKFDNPTDDKSFEIYY